MTYLLDFDGLLVNTEPHHFAAYKAALAHFGVDLEWDYATYLNYAHRDCHKEAFYRDYPILKERQPNFQALRAKKKEAYVEGLKHDAIDLMPGVESFIDTLILKGKNIAVVTNSTQEEIAPIKAHHPILQRIDRWITRERYLNPKPAPDGYLEALSLFKANRAIGLEDTVKGLKALHAAGVEPILICPDDHPQLIEALPFPYTHLSSIAHVPIE